LTVRFPDGKAKEYIINETKTVQEISEEIAVFFGKITGFSLRKERIEGERRPGRWLLEMESLPSQGISNSEILEFSKKFYFDDEDVVLAQDPAALQLLYCFSKTLVIDGAIPLARQTAVTLAALQLQVELGDYDPAVHTPKNFNPKLYLPKAYRKSSHIAKDVFEEHKTLLHKNRDSVKVNYWEQVKSVKAYGITFFEAAEKRKGYAKHLTVLIGVSTDRIVKVNADTQQIMLEEGWNNLHHCQVIKPEKSNDHEKHDHKHHEHHHHHHEIQQILLDFGADKWTLDCEEAEYTANYIESMIRQLEKRKK